jgi:hypothetical protein
MTQSGISPEDIVRAARGVYNSLPGLSQDSPLRRMIAQTDMRANERWDSDHGGVRGSYVIAALEAISLGIPGIEISDETIAEALRLVGSPLVAQVEAT